MSTFYNDNWVKISKKRLLFGEQLTKCLHDNEMFNMNNDDKIDEKYYKMNNKLSNARIEYWKNVLIRYQKSEKNVNFYYGLNNCMNFMNGDNYYNLQITNYDDENLLKLFDDLLFVN